jgi:eukaryotic-like serine/threonine-protein kinase
MLDLVARPPRRSRGTRRLERVNAARPLPRTASALASTGEESTWERTLITLVPRVAMDDEDDTWVVDEMPIPLVAALDEPRVENEWPNPPRSIGSYELAKLVSETGGVETYLAHRMSEHGAGRRVLIRRAARWRPSFRSLERKLLEDARVLACLDHPNVVTVLDVIADDGGVAIVLENLDGASLHRLNAILRARHRAMPFELASFVVAEMLRGLHRAHVLESPQGAPLGVVLRRPSPACIQITATGHVKLSGLGVAPTDGTLERAIAPYLAPEVISGDRPTPRSDIYAAGVMLFELLAGHERFPGMTEPMVDATWLSSRSVAWRELEHEGAPRPLIDVVSRATNPCPEGRYASAAEMADALDEWMLESGRSVMPSVVARLLGALGLGSSSLPFGQDKRRPPVLRIVRGGSVVVTGPTSPEPVPVAEAPRSAPRRLRAQPPPPPPATTAEARRPAPRLKIIHRPPAPEPAGVLFWLTLILGAVLIVGQVVYSRM